MSPYKNISKRRRRLYWTYGFLGIAIISGIVFVVWLNWSNRSSMYRPGEALKDVTNKLTLGIPDDAPYPQFNDVTRQAGLIFRSFSGPRSSQLPEDMGSGAAWGDYDNDGDDDLFLVSAGGAIGLPEEQRASSELFENLGDGTFSKVDDFPQTHIIGMAAAWADYNCDGWLDLAVTGYNSLILYRNHQGRFEQDENFSSQPGFWAGASWGDFDNDRDLDLYICGYVRFKENKEDRPVASRQYGRDVPYTLNPSSYEPERNLLFRNNGDGTFTEVADELEVSNLKGRSLSALWHDFNNDGWLDLYVANDISDNVLYLNKGGTFSEISHAAWVADYRGAMGLTVGDWDRDGDDDLFVTHWIAQENALYDSLFADQAKKKKNVLPSQSTSTSTQTSPGKSIDAQLRFMDVADLVGLGQIALRKIGWGTGFADLDADGWLDVIVINGSTFETSDVPPHLVPQQSFLFWNQQGKSFHNLAPLHTPLNEPRVGRGLALSDYDNDGDLDFVIINHDQGATLFRNDMNTGNRVAVRLRSRSGVEGRLNGRGEGAQLVATVNGSKLRRCAGGTSYLSQSSGVVHFGLGRADHIDTLEVHWLGGGQDIYHALEANSCWELTEGNSMPHRITLPTIPQRPVKDQNSDGQGGPESFGEQMNEQQRLTLFWQTQRAAIQALKVENDPDKAIRLFKEALSLDPSHEDSLYYLGQCLARQGQLEQSLDSFDKLVRANPSSHRGHRQWGFLRAHNAKTLDDLIAAEAALEQALAINPEETGAMLILAEINILRNEHDEAEKRLAWICISNPGSSTSYFLRAYLAWKASDSTRAVEFLQHFLSTGKDDKKPAGGTSEGDVLVKLHSDASLLSSYVEGWDGESDNIASTFATLDKHITDFRMVE